MPTAFPRAVVYDPAFSHHMTVVVRRDKGYVSCYCAECNYDVKLPLSGLETFKRRMRSYENVQICSWIEVTDDGC